MKRLFISMLIAITTGVAQEVNNSAALIGKGVSYQHSFSNEKNKHNRIGISLGASTSYFSGPDEFIGGPYFGIFSEYQISQMSSVGPYIEIGAIVIDGFDNVNYQGLVAARPVIKMSERFFIQGLFGISATIINDRDVALSLGTSAFSLGYRF